jgi:hypothetical protein
MAQSEAMLTTLMQEQATRFQVQAAQNEMLIKTLLQVQATQNEMLWKALLERSTTRGPSGLEILCELKSLLPDRTNDIVTGIEIGKSLMAHRTPAASRDGLGELLRGVVEALSQAPGRQLQRQPAQHAAPSDAELRAAVSDPVKWQHVRTVFAMKFSQRPQPTSPEEMQFRALVNEPIAWERLRTVIVASHAPQQPAAVPHSAPNIEPRSVSTAGIVPPEPTPAELRAAISDPVKWAQIRTVFAIRFSQQQPTTPEELSIRAAVADPVAWERVRTMIAANHAPHQPAAVSQPAPSPPPQPPAAVLQPTWNAAPQSVETAGAVPPVASQSPQAVEPVATVALSQPRAPHAEPVIAAADTAKPSARSTQSPPSGGRPAPTARRPMRNPLRNPAVHSLTVRAPPAQPNADNFVGCPIFCLLTAERREPVLFGGRRLPIGLG